jgi:hypothetical protein
MADARVAYEVTAGWWEPNAVQWTTNYLKTLLIERHNIRAAIENPGGSIITGGVAQAADADQLPSYSSEVGNASHLDLIEAESEISRMDARDRIELLAWCDGLSPKQAADWANIKGGKIRSTNKKASSNRIHRTVAKVTAEHNNESA